MNEVTIQEVEKLLENEKINYIYSGSSELKLFRPASLNKFSNQNNLFFLRNYESNNLSTIADSNNLVILPISARQEVRIHGNFLFTENPEISFYKIATLFKEIKESFISDKAYISSGISIGEEVTIDPFTFIGPNVVIGSNVSIGPGCIIDNCIIGDFTIIQAGISVGGDALGAIKDASQNWVDRPHFKKVLIGSRVRLEDKVVINRGFLEDTFIADEVRIGASI